MHNVRHRAPARNISPTQLDLFSWRPIIRTASPLAVRKLAERFGISIPHAATVVALAGISRRCSDEG
jgi:hypothetical protein